MLYKFWTLQGEDLLRPLSIQLVCFSLQTFLGWGFFFFSFFLKICVSCYFIAWSTKSDSLAISSQNKGIFFFSFLSPQITLQIWQSENQTHYFYKPLKSTSSFTTSDVTANIIENIKTFSLLSTNEVIWVQYTPKWGFLGSSAGKESACNAGNPSLIPGSGRSPREGIGYPLQYSWASVAAQMVKNLPIM